MDQRPNRAVVTVLLAAVVAAPLWADAQGVVEEPLDPARVLATIDRAAGFLERTQNGRGAWNDPATFPGGVTALATLALLSAGHDASDPTVSKALEFLRRLEPEKTYVVALQTMVFCAADPRRDLPLIQRNAQWLEAAQRRDGDRSGSWTYTDERLGSDPSNSQFALLALYEAQEAGAKVDPETFRRAASYWRSMQNGDGSWAYLPRMAGTGSMTCAGVGALVLCDLALADGDALVEGDQVRCCQPHDDDGAVERGLDWLGRRFSVRGNPARTGLEDSYHYYYLYGLERVGRLSARRLIGDHDWYREGTEQLVRTQDRLDHAWTGAGVEADAQIASSFALLFLAKGRRPILLAKLRHGGEDAAPALWTPHRHDALHLTQEAERAWGLPMTWQVVDPAAAMVDDLLQSPVLYVSGLEPGGLDTAAEKLRDYVDRGGFVLVEPACCGGDASRRAAEGLVAAMFPEPEHRLRRLDPSHPVWRMERVVRSESKYAASLWGVEYGCRTPLIVCEEDLSCFWELASAGGVERLPEGTRRRVEDAVTVGLNALAYATNREPRGKEQQFLERIEDVGVSGPALRGVLEVAKIRHGGGCDDAPGALANLLRAAAEGETKLGVSLETRLLGPADPELLRRPFAMMHGRRDFRFTDAERRALREYLENGGTVLADAICASEPFARAMRREVAEVMGGARLERIPADDPLLTSAFGGFDVRRVELRTPQPGAADQPLAAQVRRSAPALEGLKHNGRWVVVFSPYDLSCALERHEAVECKGYRREDAARIGLNVLLYALNQ